MFGKRKLYLAEITHLRALISDLLDRLERQEKEFAVQRKDLLDRALAAVNPVAARVMRVEETPPRRGSPEPPRSYYPGYRPDLRPPDVQPLQPVFRRRVSKEPREEDILPAAGSTLSDIKTKSTLHEVATRRGEYGDF